MNNGIIVIFLEILDIACNYNSCRNDCTQYHILNGYINRNGYK